MRTQPVIVPHREPRDLAMGQYMDAWSRVENLVRVCIREMMGVDQMYLRPVFAALMTKQTIDLFMATAKSTLNEAGVAKVSKLNERLIDRNRRRNHIVHGAWNCHVFNPATGEAIWLRKYEPVEHDLASLPYDDPKIAGMFCFTVAELARTRDLLEPVIEALGALSQEIPTLKLKPQPPETPGAKGPPPRGSGAKARQRRDPRLRG